MNKIHPAGDDALAEIRSRGYVPHVLRGFEPPKITYTCGLCRELRAIGAWFLALHERFRSLFN